MVEDDVSKAVGTKENTDEVNPFTFMGDTTTGLKTGEWGRLCELHSYNSRIDSRGELVILYIGSKYVYEDDKERSSKVALTLT